MQQPSERMINHPASILNGRYKCYHILVVLFTTTIITTMVLSARMIPFGIPFTGFEFPAPAGVLIFPFVFAITDIITEVYGYQAALRTVRLGIICLWLFVGYVYIATHMPTPAGWTKNAAYNEALSIMVRASFSTSLGLLTGIVCNSYVMSKTKIYLRGRHYVSRALFSSMFGEAVLQIMTMTITYIGTLSFTEAILPTILFSYLYKIFFNIIAGSFVTSPFQALLKKLEGIDFYDIGTNYNPLVGLVK